MKKCPNCLTLYEGPDRFCKKCGQKLKNIRSNPFRNFIITIIVIVSIIIVGLAAYLILTNYTEINLPSLFSGDNSSISDQQTQEEEISEDLTSEVPGKEELGEDQKRIISLFGYPEQFTVIFDESNNNKRIETWIYPEMDALFIFENGTYNDVEEYYGETTQKSAYKLLPEDFTYGMTPPEVEMLIGEKGTGSTDEDTGLDILTFGEGQVICIFNPDSKLIIALKQNKLSDEILN